ncbi:aminopeptidase N [Marinibactrum halimedae]|uniref:Aminopeptidase N n=1 Tax=Marinibactrum halimedae TaxID=1444977 RepID=A0AA37WR78_9GAMM|nr:aminopeptidase N [Marinibactrum halimedae]MCD9459493.1 aminopeptidase N [Marinibactrum halimedae]GLS28147.1 aminopeptidase N [Marinibactrum halimedae]
MKDAQPKTIFLKEYQVPDFLIDRTHLKVEIFDGHTIVTSTLAIRRNPESQNSAAPLLMQGQEIDIQSITLNGEPLSSGQYTVGDESLLVNTVPDTFEWVCVGKITPESNTSLEGLYRSKTMYCTQCEAEGFRKITYYLDRPDVMSEFTTTIVADKAHCPVLLSNGNLVEEGDDATDHTRHFATWHDPHKKPAYLFALVAGELSVIDDGFTTQSGREVQLRIFVEPKDLEKCDHAMTALKNSMRWDEEVYGREYDLDIFMIVAVDDFNMGAMENKGLNIFNTSCVLAHPQTTTDSGFQRVEGVVAHEYFHNWSGNRVTCRDWFQLSLKEGFTVFRDSEFSADMGSRTVKRIEDVNLLKNAQFAEDAGPMAHPVQPSSFIEISNFYTLTVYEKGAEVVRMLHTLLGPEVFRKGSDLYFERHDGQAVTIEDFVAAMSEVSGRDFTQFMNWYRQAGTPEVTVTSHYNAEDQTYALTFTQSCPTTPEATSEEKKPYLIPIGLGLVGDAGELRLQVKSEPVTGEPADVEQSDNTHRVLEITEPTQTVVFEGVPEAPVPSLLRNFSAPVKLHYEYGREELVALMERDSDGYNRWDASQKLAIAVIQDVVAARQNNASPEMDATLITAYGHLLAQVQESNSLLDPAMVAAMLTLPTENYLAQIAEVADVDAIHFARHFVRISVANALTAELEATYHALHTTEAYAPSAKQIAARSLKNVCLGYRALADDDMGITLAHQQFVQAENMTDGFEALKVLVHSDKPSAAPLAKQALADFYARWQEESLVVNQWFTVQATRPSQDALDHVKALQAHPAYTLKNPNKVRALVGAFCGFNPVNFHRADGEGYAFLADQIIALNTLNPQMAARMLTPLTKWKLYDENRQVLIRAQLERIRKVPTLSKDVYEVVNKSLK